MAGTFTVSLTADEALLLDGKCSAPAQAVVEQARVVVSLAGSGLPERERAMVAKIAATASEKGRLTYAHVMVSSCPCCGRNDGYWPHARTGKYHRKGQPDYRRPKLFRATDLSRGFVTVQNSIYVGYCDTCRDRVEPVVLSLIASIAADYPDHWAAAPHTHRRYDNRQCSECGWTGHEGEMRQSRTLMGDGFYPAGCPKCPAENRPLGVTVIKAADGFTLVERKQAAVPQ